MRDDNDIPNLDHWKTVMEFSVEQASLLMAGIDPLEMNLDQARDLKVARWKIAWGHSFGIISAIRQGQIAPVVLRGTVWEAGWNDHLEKVMRDVKSSDREAEISAQETVITRASLMNWITSANINLIRPAKPISHKPLPVVITQQAETLLLPRYEHTSEGLEFVEDAIKQFWSTYDAEDGNTAPTKQEVVKYLVSRGATKNLSEAVDLILRPHSLRNRGLKRKGYPPGE